MPAASRRESKGRASTGGSAQAKESGSRRGGSRAPSFLIVGGSRARETAAASSSTLKTISLPCYGSACVGTGFARAWSSESPRKRRLCLEVVERATERNAGE